MKFKKMKGTFLSSISWLKSHRPPQIYTVHNTSGTRSMDAVDATNPYNLKHLKYFHKYQLQNFRMRIFKFSNYNQLFQIFLTFFDLKSILVLEIN